MRPPSSLSRLLPPASCFLLAAACLASALGAAPESAADGEVTLRTVTPKEFEGVVREHKGKVVVVDCWATWCIPCLKEFKHTVEWHETYADQGLVVISLSMDAEEDRAAAEKFLKKRNATFTNLISSLGGEDDAMEKFDIDGGALPHFKLYGRDGKLIRKFGTDPDNPTDHEDVEKAIREALEK